MLDHTENTTGLHRIVNGAEEGLCLIHAHPGMYIAEGNRHVDAIGGGRGHRFGGLQGRHHHPAVHVIILTELPEEPAQ